MAIINQLFKRASQDSLSVRNTAQEFVRDVLTGYVPSAVKPYQQAIRRAHQMSEREMNIGAFPFKDRLSNEIKQAQVDRYHLGNNRWELVAVDPSNEPPTELGFIQYHFDDVRKPRKNLFDYLGWTEPSNDHAIVLQKTWNPKINGKSRYEGIGSALKQAGVEHQLQVLDETTRPRLAAAWGAARIHARDGYRVYPDASLKTSWLDYVAPLNFVDTFFMFGALRKLTNRGVSGEQVNQHILKPQQPIFEAFKGKISVLHPIDLALKNSVVPMSLGESQFQQLKKLASDQPILHNKK